MDKKHRYSAGMLAAALIVGIGIGFCGGFAVGGHTGSRQQNTTAGAEQNFETGDLSMEESQKRESEMVFPLYLQSILFPVAVARQRSSRLAAMRWMMNRC